MNRCTRVRVLRPCSGDVHVARVVVSLVVHAVVGLTLGIIARVVVVVFVVAILHRIICIWKVLFARSPVHLHGSDRRQFNRHTRRNCCPSVPP